MIFIVILKIVISTYALLMMTASVKGLRSKNFWGNVLNITSGLAMLYSNFIGLGSFKIVTIIGLIIFQLTAILNGLQNKSFHFKHHIVRSLITLVLIILIVFLT
ncbi:hypothetical protein LEMES_01173 [Leuconostoc mesenteroides]|nr:hypothetical protein LEMES_01173 [Leuconostoc mesenteroides]